MPQQVINLGATGSGAGGDSARTAFEKAIANFAELYIAALPGTAPQKAAARAQFGLGTASLQPVQTSQTDTTPGAVLVTGAFGLGQPISLVYTDINSIDTAGFFTCDECTGTPPGYTSGMLLSHGAGAVVRMQIFNPYGTDKLFFRDCLTRWNSWRELFHHGNILGPVSQSGGIPTGAIIERGSNANGEYVRFADGTQICTARVTGGYTAYVGVTRTWSASFIASPFVVCSAIPTDAVDNSFSYYGSSIVWTFLSAITSSNDIEAIGVGRWY